MSTVIKLQIAKPYIETTVTAKEEFEESSAVVGFVRFNRKQAHQVWVFIQALSFSEVALNKGTVGKALEGIGALSKFVEAEDYSEDALMHAVTLHVKELGVTVDGNNVVIDTSDKDSDVTVTDVVGMLLQHSSFYQPYVTGFLATLNILQVPTNSLSDDESKN